MAKRLNRLHAESVREKIKASQLINRLTDHALNGVELSSTQVKAIEILLKKSIPDLSAVEVSGELNGTHSHSYSIDAKSLSTQTLKELIEARAGVKPN